MTKQTLTKVELDAMAAAMDAADFGPEIEIEFEDAMQTKPKWDYSGSFDLQPPTDWDDLDEATTNESIEIEIEDNIGDNELYEDDGQPTEYEEWQDLYGGDDSIYEHDCDCMFDN